MAGTYRIGQFAELSGVSAKTLRFYDEIGLLRPAGVDARTRYRRYLPEQLPVLAMIVSLKKMGLPLAQVRELVRGRRSPDFRPILEELKRGLHQQVEAALESLTWIERALDSEEDAYSSFAVTVKRRPALPIASIRAKLSSYAEIVSLEDELRAALPPSAAGEVRGVLWHRCADSDYLEGEAFVSLTQLLPRRSYYDVKSLPAVIVASAYSKSEDLSAERAYDAIRDWMRVRGHRLSGPKRELYLGDMLEIQFPLS